LTPTDESRGEEARELPHSSNPAGGKGGERGTQLLIAIGRGKMGGPCLKMRTCIPRERKEGWRREAPHSPRDRAEGREEPAIKKKEKKKKSKKTEILLAVSPNDKGEGYRGHPTLFLRKKEEEFGGGKKGAM